MNTGVFMKKQGDDLYEVQFSDGSKKSNLSFEEAVSIMENYLYGDFEKPRTE